MKLSPLFFAAAVVFSSAAQAVTFNGDVVFGTPFNSNPAAGLPVFALDLRPSFIPDNPSDPDSDGVSGPRPPFVSKSFSFNLDNPGDSFNTDVMVVTTGDNLSTQIVDFIPQPFSLIFSFNGLSTAISGTTSVVADSGGTFEQPSIHFGSGMLNLGNGLALEISLPDGVFNVNTNSGSFTPGESNGLFVSAQFTLVSAVPEPATLPLMAGGLGLLAIWSRRAAMRRSRA